MAQKSNPIKTEGKGKIFFPNLDGLRTIACLMVFIWHALGIGNNSMGIRSLYVRNFMLAFFNGKTGVLIFFVLSGFLITYIILSEIIETGSLNLGKFYMRRVLRIWPLYFSVLIFVFVIIPILNYYFSIISTHSDVRPFYYFIFIGNFDVLHIYETGGSDFLPSTITWSVAIEEQFYLFWPLLFFFVPVSKYKYVFIFLIISSLGLKMLNYDRPAYLYFHSFSATYSLAIGGATAFLCIKSQKFRNFFIRMGDRQRVLIFCLGLALLYFTNFAPTLSMQLAMTLLQVFFFSFLIMDQCLNGSARLKFSNSKLLTGIGKYTYGMYMLHPIVLVAINTIAIRFLQVKIDSSLCLILSLCVGLPATIMLSIVSFNVLEKRFLKLKDKFAFMVSMTRTRQ